MKSINDLVIESYQNAIDKGWQKQGQTRPIPELIALIHSEVSEVLEEFRNARRPDETYYNGLKPEGIPIELADVCIRVFDLCGQYGIDLEKAIETKMEFNKTRPLRHGGKIV
jgi:NTP pyrophosphatase (non-canonical NTP hydrolase)